MTNKKTAFQEMIEKNFETMCETTNNLRKYCQLLEERLEVLEYKQEFSETACYQDRLHIRALEKKADARTIGEELNKVAHESVDAFGRAASHLNYGKCHQCPDCGLNDSRTYKSAMMKDLEPSIRQSANAPIIEVDDETFDELVKMSNPDRDLTRTTLNKDINRYRGLKIGSTVFVRAKKGDQ